MDPTNNQTPVPEAPATGTEQQVVNPAAQAAPILSPVTEAAPVADADLQQVAAAMEAVVPEAVSEAVPAPEVVATPAAETPSVEMPQAAAPVLTPEPVVATASIAEPAPTPVAPAVSTAMPATEALATPAAAEPAPVPAPASAPDLSNPLGASATAFQASVGGMVAATDPITMPSPPAEQDPVEAELEAPIKAADPVPGSIGSAISVPAEGGNAAPAGNTPNVAFNDPAVTNNMTQNPAMAAKKPGLFANLKLNKTTLILLCVVAGLVVLALVVVLILQLNG